MHNVFYVDVSSPSGLRWAVPNGTKMKAGDVAGTKHKAGYWQVQLLGKVYKVHRVVAFLEGILPSMDCALLIDHKDGINSNNTPINLRVGSSRNNAQNNKRHRAGALVGTHFCNTKRKWLATIKIDGRPTHLGSYTSEVLAHAAYIAKLEELGERDASYC